ncbi:YceI family protein [Polaribacter litorisediminis]|uniref:YceI family protein n=1 Tax=Polaribacter litorisediminis TaxID=1908341 RepID=UPI001CBFD19D|nr:YceI family protein [Polaribacter litorisediminis]UAM97758.1 YceI family protein [Polaribacter litorisediminis]
MNRFIRVKNLFLVLLICTLTSFSQEASKINNESEITFTIKNFGFNVDGNFNEFKVLSNFNFAALKESFLNVEIDVKSIFTGIESRDQHLLETAYFNAKTYPKIIFNATEIEKIANFKYLVKGFITIKGIKKRLETPIEIIESGENIIVKANFELDRKDFDVGGNSLVLANKVKVKMRYVTNKN